MNFSEPFIRRPVATTLLTLGIALLGIAAYFVLPVAALPQMDMPTISVQASLPGASPDVMATSVATPLERAMSQIADVTEMTSQSSTNRTQITLQFGLDRDINGAARDVQAAINAARSYLPTLPHNPTYRKVNPANAPIMVLALTSDTLTLPDVYNSADLVVNQAISQINGVGEVFVGGGTSPAVRVEMDPYALNKYGISLEDVKAALQSTNAFTPKGALTVGEKRLQIYTNDQATTAAQFRDVIVAYRNGAPVRIRDIAQVIDGQENINNMGLANGKPAIVVRITAAPGANVVATVDRIKAMLPLLRSRLPPAVQLSVIVDNSRSIRASLAEVERTLLIAVVLVVVVVLLFLRNGRATLIPGVAVTVSLLGTLAIMFLFHFSLDNLSLMALTVATGFVVDDAIVVLENITRHVENGTPRFQAALVGSREVGFTVLSMSISLVAVFIPILAMGGIVGRLFREFGVTLSAAIFISLILSLTATPMMAARLIDEPARGAARRARSWWKRFWGAISDRLEWGFDRILRTYEKSLVWALDNAPIVLTLLLLTVGLTIYLYIVVPKGFFPQEDSGLLVGGIQADQASSFKDLAPKVTRMQAIIMHDPDVASAAGFTYPPGGFMFVTLKPKPERKVSSDQVIQRLTPKLMRIPGARLFLQTAQDIRVGGRQSNAQYQYTLQSDDSQALHTWSDRLLRELYKYKDLSDVNTDQQVHALATYLTIDRATASRFGITAQQIDTTLGDAFGQSFASIIYNPLNQYHVVLEVAQPYQQGPDALKLIYVSPPGAAGSLAASAARAGVRLSSGGGGRGGVLSLSASSGTSAGAASLVSPATGSTTSASPGASAGPSAAGGVGGASPVVSSPTTSNSTVGNVFGGATASGLATTGGSAGITGPTTLSSQASGLSAPGAVVPGGSAAIGLGGAASGGSGSRAADATTTTITALGGTATSGAGVARQTTGGATRASTGVAISTSPETMVPLSAFSSYALQTTPLAVNHQGLAVATTLSFNLAPGKSLSDAQRDIAQAVNDIHMPNNVVGHFQGTAQVFQQSLATEPILIATALLAVYIVLGVLYESYIHPLTVLSTLPSAGVGALLALLIFHVEFSIISLIGIVLLIGIVKKNAIMIIDFALVAERDQGLSSRDAIFQASMLRFRPILMTTCAAIMGAVPLAIGLGQGGELRQPLGVSIIGGLVASQLLTLLTTPVVYLYLDRLRQRTPRSYPRGLGGSAPAPMPAE